MTYKRTFIAIKVPLNESLKDMLTTLKSTFKSSKINWIKDDSCHITLHFLGNTSPEQIEMVKKIITEIAIKHPASDILIEGMGTFKHNGQPSVIWAGLKNCENMVALQADMAIKLRQAGFTLEERAFKPHLTLGRIKVLNDKTPLIATLSELKNISFGKLHVDVIHYYESILHAHGPEYKVISSEKLTKT